MEKEQVFRVRLFVLVGLVSETNPIGTSELNLVVFLCVLETMRGGGLGRFAN